MFETKCAQFLFQKAAFEEKVSDQNKERQWEGGAAEAQEEGKTHLEGLIVQNKKGR